MASPRLLLVWLSICLVTLPVQAQRSRGGHGLPSHTSPAGLTGVVVTFKGEVKKLTKKELLLESDDNQLLTLRCSRKTRFYDKDGAEIKLSEVDLESRVSVEASEDADVKLLALRIKVDSTPKRTLDR